MFDKLFTNSVGVLKAAKPHAAAALSLAQRVARHRVTRAVAPMVAVIAMHTLMFTTGVFAQGTGGRTSIGGAAYRMFQEIYDEWRGPICLVALVAGAILLMTTGRNAHHWIFKIVGGIVFFALAPELYNTLNYWGGGK